MRFCLSLHGLLNSSILYFASPPTMAQTRILILEDGENLETVLFRVRKGWTIQFKLGASLQPLKVKIYCNHPAGPEAVFARTLYNELTWTNPNLCQCDLGDRFCTLEIIRAGTFHFYACDEDKFDKPRCQGYLVVEPTLTVRSGELPVDQVVMQTVLSKCLGPLNEWQGRLKVSKKANYNAIHFSPIQELGESNSSYSLKNHHVLNPNFGQKGKPVTYKDIKNFTKHVQDGWNMISIVDVVWNHAANNAEWLSDHPESAYSVVNSPHLRPAFLVDRSLWHLSQEIMEGRWDSHGIPNLINLDYHLEKINEVLRKFVLPQVRLQDFFLVNIDAIVDKFKKLLINQSTYDKANIKEKEELEILQDPAYKRHGCTINMDLALKIFTSNQGARNEHAIKECCDVLKSKLQHLNDEKLQLVQEYHDAIIFNSIGHIRYHFVDYHGPRLGMVSEKNSIVTRYFTCPWESSSLAEDEKLMDTTQGRLVFAHNGWVMGGDALKDFAASDSSIYLKRELIAWGDSVKLKYGEKPEDAPFLWNYMKQYTQEMASIFHGFRIDNCHSTPIPIAQYLLDAAREVNPELYVLAELFTDSEAVDNTFINKLGINSLIRERMSAHDAHDLGRHVYRYGGAPVGSFITPSSCPLRPSVAHALFMDLTHDNRSPIEVRSSFDFLASSALVAISCCGIGSNRGYDEMVPEHISVVKDERFYQKYTEDAKPSVGEVTLNDGILRGKKQLNYLHIELEKNGYSQIFVDQVNKDVVSVTRHCPISHESVILVSHTAFTMPAEQDQPKLNAPVVEKETIPPLVIPGMLDKILFEAILMEDPDAPEFVRSNEYINGLRKYCVEMQIDINVNQSKICKSHFAPYESSDNDRAHEVHFVNFPPGSVIVFKVSPKPKVKKAIQVLRSTLSSFREQGYRFSNCPLTTEIHPVGPIIQELSLADLNRVLYRCHNEEVDDGMGGGVYVVPDVGSLVYCGLQGFITMLSQLTLNNDLGHSMCDNLRQGNWMPDYVAYRLKHNHGTRQLGLWFESVFWYLKELPRYLIPCYFEAILRAVYMCLVDHSFTHLSDFVQSGSSFIKCLALGSIQMCGLTNSARFPALSHNLKKSYQQPASPQWQIMLTMAAGLPHFSTGFMRCWGRDTFIALRGLLLITGRFAVARNLILGFAGCLRHGLIPNLLGGGVSARYNCRDAVWWWLEAIQNFCKMAPNGIQILSDQVVRMYPTDDSPAVEKDAKEQPLYDVIQEALQRHINGISFRERNAGSAIDASMSWEGFNQSAGVNLETGFVYGGNKWNCGTWMDKMGESHQAGNWGHPATPRDGSAVEIVGLCKSAVTWLHSVYQNGKYPYAGVNVRIKGKEVMMSFKEWSSLIQNNFEKHFWIPVESSSTKEGTNKLIHRRGIYKDSVGSSNQFTDYQLRPNFPIAMAVAPELFEPQHAWTALKEVEDVLLGPLGLATLDYRDWAYDGNYDNSQDSGTFNTARGFNYHQGPEWLWILGPFLRAKLHFAQCVGGRHKFTAATKRVLEILARHKEEINSSVWHGLPELTNARGAFCRDGCPSQAWSMGCLLEVVYDMEAMIKVL